MTTTTRTEARDAWAKACTACKVMRKEKGDFFPAWLPNEYTEYEYRVVPCPLHAAAEDMAQALKDAVGRLEWESEETACCRCRHCRARQEWS